MTRVRYFKTELGMFVSKEMIGNGDLLRIVINPTTMIYKLLNSNDTPLRSSDVFKNMSSLKSSAKKTLKEFGVVFSDEIRKREKNEQETIKAPKLESNQIG